VGAPKGARWGIATFAAPEGTERKAFPRGKEPGMKTVKIVYWQEPDGMWLGHLESFPDYLTQGETLEELKENLKSLLADLEEGGIPVVRYHEEIEVA
jgi:predicted RNase H-like HicB family nuclease